MQQKKTKNKVRLPPTAHKWNRRAQRGRKASPAAITVIKENKRVILRAKIFKGSRGVGSERSANDRRNYPALKVNREKRRERPANTEKETTLPICIQSKALPVSLVLSGRGRLVRVRKSPDAMPRLESQFSLRLILRGFGRGNESRYSRLRGLVSRSAAAERLKGVMERPWTGRAIRHADVFSSSPLSFIDKSFLISHPITAKEVSPVATVRTPRHPRTFTEAVDEVFRHFYSINRLEDLLAYEFSTDSEIL